MSDIEELPTWVRDNQAYWVDLTAVDSSEHGVQRAKPIKANVGGSANVMSSSHSQYPDRHKVMLDLDVRHKLIPSTTPGHSHLNLDVDLSSDDYERLLNALRRRYYSAGHPSTISRAWCHLPTSS